ncbi:hypothetical protein Zmor_017573 [Zophobas morio]|uniref:Farnesyl pyrophosphate synthase n=1 Tax=Zophobas morio TaxID=2755281 RepID=A0AA38ICD5_9CUCU|nr:hypothetical protein Zmor_017573 [Zophobas morio]
MRTGLGEVADCVSVKDGKPQLQLFTMDRFKRIAEYKTGFYTFYLPIALAMYMANIYDLELHRKSEDLSKDLTFLYRVQDDFIDCYGNPEKSGKKGTDIQEGKCTWLAVMAMKKANHYQIETLKQCYGSKDPEAITTVINLFEELNLKDIYQSSVEESVNHIRKKITQNITWVRLRLWYDLSNLTLPKNAEILHLVSYSAIHSLCPILTGLYTKRMHILAISWWSIIDTSTVDSKSNSTGVRSDGIVIDSVRISPSS